ncbi:hypothetical protein [Vibrio furnissii]|uniref:hypothetical protein n=1 Tax=Vibrio furnissii TaxID=29494 RepID=UPI0001B92436|nr:hypothetical protein [Vibrio furnissii]EEX39457.1 hypothetical protein VFA_003753 [Vibrio furnissii CIP 102972]QDC91815.1 hypothetical protein FIU11_03270 [Vibrio furnissii]UON46818.1 hypothetical protein IUJ52_07725 [Vibrio furnissii]SUP42744.1 Uncharacterised protein [Vibrio furnissii]
MMRLLLPLISTVLGVWLCWPSHSNPLDTIERAIQAALSQARPQAARGDALNLTDSAAPSQRASSAAHPDNAQRDLDATPQPTAPLPDAAEEETPLEALLSSGIGTEIIISAGEHALASDEPPNQPPELNQQAYQRISEDMATWQLSTTDSAHYQINIDDLFRDPEGDLITYRVSINSRSLKLALAQSLTLNGLVEPDLSAVTVLIEANDDHHQEDAWQSVSFTLANIDVEEQQDSQQLENKYLYRIHTTRELGGKRYDFDVLYCEGFYLDHGTVLYAMSQSRLTCPTPSDFKKVGYYQRRTQDIDFDLDSNTFMRWTFRQSYTARMGSGTNFLVTSYNGDRYETDTLMDVPAAAEARLNVTTGQYLYQTSRFDYLMLNEQHHYYWVSMMNYIYNRRLDNPDYYQPADSDLNITAEVGNLSCRQFEPYFAFSSLTGMTEYQQTLMVFSGDYYGNYPPACFEYQNPQRLTNLSSDLEYSEYDIPLDGEIYTYILRPRPEYAHLLETFKINLIYRQPVH